MVELRGEEHPVEGGQREVGQLVCDRARDRGAVWGVGELQGEPQALTPLTSHATDDLGDLGQVVAQ